MLFGGLLGDPLVGERGKGEVVAVGITDADSETPVRWQLQAPPLVVQQPDAFALH